MTVEADLYSALTGLVSGRVYPDVAPTGAARPYITYQQIGGEAVAFLESVMPSKKNGRFQINVWADTRLAVASLSVQVETALVQSTTLRAQAIGAPAWTYEVDTKLYGTNQDFSIFSDR